MAEIELRNVDKHFGALHVIRDVNLTVADKEFVVFLGPSGCGKTTTLRAIAGLEDIDSGDILIDGKPVQSSHASERDIAFVFQNDALYPHLAVYENVALGGPVRPADVAECVLFALTRPPNVNVDEIVVTALAQSSGARILREE